MEAIERTGRTVEEAIGEALKELGLSREEVDIEVIAEESRGLLGILGYSAAKVRVTPKAQPEEIIPVGPSETDITSEKPIEDRLVDEVETDERELEAEGKEYTSQYIEEYSELARHAREILLEILGLIGSPAQVDVVSDNEEGVSIDIHSAEDVGLLIGKHGQTLAALQLIVSMIANRQVSEEQRRRIILDAEGYRARRDNSLKEMARNAAQRAKRSGRPVTLDSLTPRERRVVHLALADDPSVTTRSEGEDPNRSIIVTARRKPRSRQG